MPRRTLLSPTQRAQFTEPATTPRELIQHYTLTDEDLEVIHRHRGSHNRLGFAVQLCYLRFPGRVFQLNEDVPVPLLSFIAEQLTVDPDGFEKYAERETTRREHLLELQASYWFHPFNLRLYRELSEWLLPIASKTDNGIVLVSSLLEEMRRKLIIIG